MPQWDFLNFLTEHAKVYPRFHLLMEHEVVDLIEESGRVAGVRCITPDGPRDIRAALTVGADGRNSVLHEIAGLEVIDLGAPIDVLWMRLSRQPNDPDQTLGRARNNRVLVTRNRGDYWQCAYVIPKGSAEELRQKGPSSFRDGIAR